MAVRSGVDAEGSRAILVTGATGFVGRHVTGRLAGESGRPVVAVDIHEATPWPLESPVRVRVGDVSAPAVLNEFRTLAPSVIVHLASVTNSMIRDREYMLERNVGDFDLILELAESVRARVIFASSAAVYGNGPVPMHETQEPCPHNPYALSKLMMEQRADAARQRGLSVLALRFFNVYGPGEAHKRASASMVFQIHAALARGEPARLFRDGTQGRDFVHVDDISAAILAAVGSDVQGTMNLGSGESTTFNDLVAAIAAEIGATARIEYVDEPRWEYQRRTWARVDRARERLDFRPRPLAEGIRDFVAAVATVTDE